MSNEKPEFYAILTEAGRALQFECMNTDKKFVMSGMAVGDGNGSYYEPEKTQAKLKNECYRHAITRKMTDKKGLVKSVILDIPENVYGFTIREVGVYGENGELLLIGKYPATPKLKPESGAISQLAIKVNLTQINELVLPVLIDPSVNTASVQYVEEHFQKLEEKGKANGYASLDENGIVPLKQLSNVLPTFCFNSGAVDSQGNSALMTVGDDILTLNAPAVGTTANGETFTVSENVTLDISEVEDEKFKCYYNPETVGLEIYDNAIFEQKTEPVDWNINDIWVDTSIMPNISYKKVSDSEKVAVKLVQTADLERVSEGGGVTLSNKEYNYPDAKLISQVDKITDDITNIQNSVNGNIYLNGTSWRIIYPNKWCEQGGRALATYTGTAIELLQEYKDMNYNGLAINYGGNTSATINTAFTVKSTSRIILASGYTGSSQVIWRTWGKIA